MQSARALIGHANCLSNQRAVEGANIIISGMGTLQPATMPAVCPQNALNQKSIAHLINLICLSVISFITARICTCCCMRPAPQCVLLLRAAPASRCPLRACCPRAPRPWHSSPWGRSPVKVHNACAIAVVVGKLSLSQSPQQPSRCANRQTRTHPPLLLPHGHLQLVGRQHGAVEEVAPVDREAWAGDLHPGVDLRGHERQLQCGWGCERGEGCLVV